MNSPKTFQVDFGDKKWPAAKRTLSQARRKARSGDIIEFMTDNHSVFNQAKAWCEGMGDTVERTERDNSVFVASVKVVGREGQIQRPAGKRFSLEKTVKTRAGPYETKPKRRPESSSDTNSAIRYTGPGR